MKKYIISAVIALITTGAACGAENCKTCDLLYKISKADFLTFKEKTALYKTAKKTYAKRMADLFKNHQNGHRCK